MLPIEIMPEDHIDELRDVAVHVNVSLSHEVMTKIFEFHSRNQLIQRVVGRHDMEIQGYSGTTVGCDC